MTIAESDWKTFKRVREQALERLSQRILDECQALCGDDGRSAHERYLELCRLVEERDRQIARAFNAYSRSTALRCLTLMVQLDLLRDEERAEFSEDVQALLAMDQARE